MNRIEELNSVIAELEPKHELLYQKIAKANDNHKISFNSIFANNGFPEIKTLYLAKENLRIGFPIGKWGNGEPKYQELDVYYRSHYGYEDKHLFLNTACFGDFPIDQENDVKTYFTIVGRFCSDESFVHEILVVWNHYIEEIKPLYEEANSIAADMQKAKNEIRDIETADADAKLFVSQQEMLKNNPDAYVVVRKGKKTDEVKHYVYRKCPVYWDNDEMFATQYDAYVAAKQRPIYPKYTYVAVADLKTVA